jgi:class 3 adenylate cyclase
MPSPEAFRFERSRGIVWVGDIADSSKYLNDDQAVDALEDFLPRLHWTASTLVDAAGGEFIKWTGDGFLAWFPTPLHRHLGTQAAAVFEAAWHLTLLVNVTQLGVATQRRFQIRHGVTYEQDALITRIRYPGGFETLDLTGRNVVLAFRLSGVVTDFPGIVTQRELVQASTANQRLSIDFRAWKVTREEQLKYFKGEKWGIRSVYRSGFKKQRRRSRSSVTKLAKQLVARVEGAGSVNAASMAFAIGVMDRMMNGPEWCRTVVDDYMRFVRDELLGTLKRLIPILEGSVGKDTHSGPTD